MDKCSLIRNCLLTLIALAGSASLASGASIASDTSYAVPALGREPRAAISPESILLKWEATYGSVSALGISYKELRTATIPPDGLGKPAQEIQTYWEMDKISDGERYYVRHTADPRGLNDAKSVIHMAAFDGEQTTLYGSADNTGSVVAGPRNRNEPGSHDFYTFLGRVRESAITKERQTAGKPSLLAAFRDYSRNGSVRESVKVRSELEMIGGEPCHVMEVDQGNGKRTVWFAHTKGMVIMREELSATSFSRTVEVAKLASVETETGVFWYPERATMKLKLPTGGSEDRVFECQRCIPNPKLQAGVFRLKFPKGTQIVDLLSVVR